MIKQLRDYRAECDATACGGKLVFSEAIGLHGAREFWRAGWGIVKTKMNHDASFRMWHLCPRCMTRLGLEAGGEQERYLDEEPPEWLGNGVAGYYDC